MTKQFNEAQSTNEYLISELILARQTHEKEILQWQKLAALLFDSDIHEHTDHKKWGRNSTYCKICTKTRGLYWDMQMKHFANEQEYCDQFQKWIEE